MNSKFNSHICSNGSTYSCGTGCCKCQMDDIPLCAHTFLAPPIEVPKYQVAMNPNQNVEIHQDIQDSCTRKSTSGFKLLSVKRLSVDNNSSMHRANTLSVRPLLNGDGNAHSNTANGARLYLDNRRKFQSHTCNECHMSNDRWASDPSEVYEYTDDADDAGISDIGGRLCTGKCSSRCIPAYSRECVLPYSAIVNHLRSGNDLSNSYVPSRTDPELMQVHSAIRPSGHQNAVHEVESSLSDFTSAAKVPKYCASQHVNLSACNCCRVPCSHWDMQYPGQPHQLVSRVAAVDHSNNNHFHLQPTQSIQTAPVSGHSSPTQANASLLINETSSVPESTSFCTTTAVSGRCLTANNCDFEASSASHNAASGWLIHVQDNGPILVYPSDLQQLRHHHQLAPVPTNSAPLQPVFNAGLENGTSRPNHLPRKCAVMEMGTIVPIPTVDTSTTSATVMSGNDDAVTSVAVGDSLTSHFLIGSGAAGSGTTNTNQPQNGQISILGEPSASPTTLQPASRFRKARIYETVEQWSFGRTSVHDCRLKVIPEWVVKLRGKPDAFACEIFSPNCLSCLQSKAIEILPGSLPTSLKRKTQPSTSIPEASDLSDSNTSDMPDPRTSCGGMCSKMGNLFSYWNEGNRISEHSRDNFQVYLSATHPLEHYHQSDMQLVPTNGVIDQPSELLSDQSNAEDTVCTTSVPILPDMLSARQNGAKNGIHSTRLILSSSSGTGPNSPIPPDSDTITQLHSGHHHRRLDPSTDYLRRYPTAAPLSSPSSSLLPEAPEKLPIGLPGEENGHDCPTAAVAGLHSLADYQSVSRQQQQYLPESTASHLSQGACKGLDQGSGLTTPDGLPAGCSHVLNNTQQESSTVPATVMATSCDDCGRYFLVARHAPSSASVPLGGCHGLPNESDQYQLQQRCCCSHHRSSANMHRLPPGGRENDASRDSAVIAQQFEARIHDCVNVVRSTLFNALRDIEADKVNLTSQLNAYHIALHRLRDFVPSDAWNRICGDLAPSPAVVSSHDVSNGNANASNFEGQQSSSV